MKTAFVASTLPARFLLDNWERLGVSRVVCGSESLKLSFLFLKDKSSSMEIFSVPSGKEERESFLYNEVSRSQAGVIIFHECCWRELDLVILKVQPPVEFYPCVTLDSWKKLSTEELGFPHLIKRLIVEKNKNLLRLIYFSLRYGRDFDFYEVVEDNGNKNKSYQTVCKECRIKKLQKSNECLTSRQLLKSKNIDVASKNVMFILATDVVSNEWQEEIFYKIADFCKKNGYMILVKDHPNPNARLNLKEVGQVISPNLPFEVIEEPYLAKIGLFSTTLAFEAEKSISIADLFSPLPQDFSDRKKHLLAIPGGDKITFIKNLEDLKSFLQAKS